MRSIFRFRQHIARVLAKGALLIVVSMLSTPTSLAATPSQWGVSWDFKLLGNLNTAQDPATGFTVLITGSGSFDISQQSIDGGGSYTILDTEGNIVGNGTWRATTFDSFIAMGPGNSPGEGGHLEIEAIFTGTGTSTLNGSLHTVVQCSMWGPQVEPPGYPWPPDFVEVGSYTTHKTGAVMFNLNQ